MPVLVTGDIMVIKHIIKQKLKQENKVTFSVKLFTGSIESFIPVIYHYDPCNQSFLCYVIPALRSRSPQVVPICYIPLSKQKKLLDFV